MDFKTPYLLAMQDQAPKMFNELRKTGALSGFVAAKSAEAHKMLDEATADLPKTPSGAVASPQLAREAEEKVLSTLIEFPSEGRIADVDGEPIPQPQLQTG